MKPSFLTNILILVAVAVFGYSLTVYFDNKSPQIIKQPEAPSVKMKDSLASPDFTFTTPDGTQHTLHGFKDKIILLNFWASWCPPCVKEFPHFIEIAENYKDDVIFIALSSDTNEEAMMNFVRKLEAEPNISLAQENIIIALDTDNVTQQTFSTFRLPETLIIDRNSNIREKLIGADWTVEYLEEQIEKLISE